MKMSLNEETSDKKRALLSYKSKLLNDLHYCEKRIEEISKKQTQTYYDDGDSSDSDTDLLLPVKLGPTTQQLRAETSQLNLCLQATQELTSLEVLESEVNILVDPPKLKDGNYPEEEGVWREALAECKVDLIPYCITFFIFQPSKRFGNPSFYQLKVTPTKSGHEKELGNSILSKLTRPSDAWQVLKSYSVASRSRRSTMARLCDKFGDAIVVGAAEDGGFTIKCADLLEISWSLQNIWSPVMPFQHKLKFDLEYMDEHYIKTIKHAHKQLSDPSLGTDERTDILTKILNTCIEASGNMSSVTESETDQSVHLTPVKRRTTLEEEPVIPVKRRTESVMPPPKGVPKKTKTKDKENVNLNRNGLELQENTGSSKYKGSVKDNLNKNGNSKTKDDILNRDRLANDQGVSKDKVTGSIKHNVKAIPKETAKENTNLNYLKKNKEPKEVTKSKADKPVKETEICSKLTAENKQKKSSQAKENSAKDDNVSNKKPTATKPNDKTDKPNENRKKTNANRGPENENIPKTNENRQETNDNRNKTSANRGQENENRLKTNENRTKTSANRGQENENRLKTNENRKKTSANDDQENYNIPKTNEKRQRTNEIRQKSSERPSKVKENRPTSRDNRPKTTENNAQHNKNEDKRKEKEKQKDSRQKQPETHQPQTENRHKPNEDRQKTNEKQNNIVKQNDNEKQNYNDKQSENVKQNDNEKQNYKGKNNPKQDKRKAVSKIPKLFKNNFKPQNFISKRLSGRINKNTSDEEININHFEKKLLKKDPPNESDKRNVIKRNDGTKKSDKFEIKTDKYRLISKSRAQPLPFRHTKTLR